MNHILDIPSDSGVVGSENSELEDFVKSIFNDLDFQADFESYLKGPFEDIPCQTDEPSIYFGEVQSIPADNFEIQEEVVIKTTQEDNTTLQDYPDFSSFTTDPGFLSNTDIERYKSIERKELIKLSYAKLEKIVDPTINLRRSVCIYNTHWKLTKEVEFEERRKRSWEYIEEPLLPMKVPRREEDML